MEKQNAGVGWPRHWTRKFCSRGAGSITAMWVLLALALALPLGTMAQAAGTPWAWGYNWAGQLGDGTTTNSNVPVQVLDLTDVMAIAGGSYHHSLALMIDGTVRAWGSGNNGQLGIGTGANSSVPVQVLGLTGVTAIAAGQDHSLAIKNDGTAWAWGWNVFGQLGIGTTTTSFIPVQVMGIAGVTALSGGGFHSLGLKNDGTVWTWGYNYFGQLGNGTTTASNVPVQVLSLAGMTAIAGAVNHSLALKNDGTVWAWGHNWNGALGNGTNTDSHVPVQVLGLAGVTALAGVGEHSLALKNDGTVWAWGYNSSGQLGNGTNTSSNVPVQVIGLTGVSAIGGGGDNSLALKNDGTVWAWGHNNFGQLGDGTNTNSNVPVQVFGLTGVSAIGGCGYHVLALRSAASCVPPPTGMVAWYGLDEQTGATTIADSAPSPGSIVNNAGTPQPGPVGQGGPSHVAGMVGAGALYFTGPYVDVTPQVELDFDRGDFSIDAWVRPVPCGAAGFLSPVVDKWDTTNIPTGFSLYLTQTAQYSASVTLQFNAQTFTSTGSFTADASTWHHIAVTISRATFPGTGIFYIDGAPAGTFVPPAGTLTNTLPMWIGKTRVPGGLCEIAIDELELFNREITHAEVQGIHDALSAGKCRCVPPPSGMVAWWPLDETSGTAAADIVPLPAVPHPGTVQPGPIGSSVSTGPVSSIYWPLAPWNFPPGMVANSLAFTEHDRIEVPTAPALEPGASGFTVDAWVIYQPDPVGGPSVIISKMNPAGGPGYVLGIPGGLLKFQVIGSSASLTATALVVATPGIWHHVAATFQRNPDTLLLYVDGGLLPVTATTATIGGVTNGSMVLIGGNGGFAGLLGVDEVEIFNRALELSEVKLLSDARESGKCKGTACTLTCTASASVSSGLAPLPVTFTGGATVSDGSTPSYHWDFGDSNSSTVQSPTYTYTTCGTFTWTLTVTACGQTCTKTGTVTVTGCCPVISLSPATLPGGTVGVVYTQTISASGSTAPYTFAVTAGSLPPGLTINPSTGVIFGSPTTAGPYTFTVTATDPKGCTGSHQYSLVIRICQTITLSPINLPDGTVGVLYNQTITASGGTAPYTFALTAGSLPPGLILDPATGVISGTPITAGPYGFVVTATDASGCHGSHDYNVSVGAGCSFPITLKPGTIAGGTVGALYTQPINASGGTAPYTYTLSAGSLPPGLTLNPATGVISGTPTTAGTYTFTLTATDANKCTGSAQFSLVVGSCTYGPVVIISIHYTGGWVYINFTGTGILCGDPPIGVDDDWVRADLIKYAKNKGRVKLTFTQNPSATPRSANVFIGGAVFPVEQAGAPCKVSAVSPTKLMVGPSGGEQSFAVMAPEGACEWIASPNGSAGSWIDIPSGSGSGPGAVSFMVSPNTTGKNRTGTISVRTALGKKNVTVKQSR